MVANIEKNELSRVFVNWVIKERGHRIRNFRGLRGGRGVWSRRRAKATCGGVRGKKLKSGGRKWKRKKEVCFKETKWMAQSEQLTKVPHKIVRQNKEAARVEDIESRQRSKRNLGRRDDNVSGRSGEGGKRVGGSRSRAEKRAHRGREESTGKKVEPPTDKNQDKKVKR